MIDNNPNDGSVIPESVLVRVKMKLCVALGINTTTLKALIDRYVMLHYGHASTKMHFARVNMYNELASAKMTIKVFFKFLMISRIKKVEFTVKVTTVTDRVVTVVEEVNLMNFNEGKEAPFVEEKVKPAKETVSVKVDNGK